MAVTRKSSRTEIKNYQQQLNDAGAKPALVIDGIWGPKTQAASDKWGDSTDEGTPDAVEGDPLEGTGPEGTEPRFGLAGGAELWKNSDTGDSYIVYVVPGTEDDPVYMRWLVPSDADVQSFFGPGQPVKYQQTYGGSDKIWGDTIDFGGSDDIANTSKSPFDSWASTLEAESASKPWILDEDYQKLLAMSVIENRDLTSAELQTTKYWKDHDDSQREWMRVLHGDPATAQQKLDDRRLQTNQWMLDAGISNPDEDLVNWMSDKYAKGDWSKVELDRQIQLLSDDYYSDVPLNEDLQKYIDENEVTVDMNEDMGAEVRGLVKQWLGTNFGEWSDEQVNSWAGRLRNEPDAREALMETLKDQKTALFPEYDREADYQTIASPWRTQMRNQWGKVPDDSDAMLHSVIRMNDAGEAGKLLTQEGLKRGYDTTVNSVQSAMSYAFGGN